MSEAQLSAYRYDVAKVIRELQHQAGELDLIILKTPTGQVRNDLTEGVIHLQEAIGRLLNVV